MPDAFPSPAALDVHRRLDALITAEVAAAGGWIRFSRFMELALYAPGLGYYSAGAVKVGGTVGDGSDFVTAPELTPLFGQTLARLVADVLADGGDTIVELGGGSGRLALDLLTALERLGRLPAVYRMLEVSGDLRDRQRTLLEQSAPHLAARVEWIERLPAFIDGVVLANEVLDALPVELVAFDGCGWQVRGVERAGDAFGFADRGLPADLRPLLARCGLDDAHRAPGYVTEVHPAADALVRALIERLSPRSVALLIDYGFPASEYYHPQRTGGTLMAHRRHHASPDVLTDVGLRDVTAHVDFSAVARAAHDANGTVLGYTSQAAFLIDCGITESLSGNPDDLRAWARQATSLQTLLSEAEMGELFKVIALGRSDRSLRGFRQDRSAAL